MKPVNLSNRVALPIVLRPMVKNDVPYILSSWIKSYRDLPANRQTNRREFYNMFSPLVNNILKKSGAIVACNADDYNHIYGYVVAQFFGEELVIHWINVKYSYRKAGIGTALYNRITKNITKPPLASFWSPRAKYWKTIKDVEYSHDVLPSILKLDGKPISEVMDF